MGSDVITVDFDGVLTEEQLYDVEQEANKAVLRNVPVTISYPSKEELETMDYRSKKEIEGQVRIVTIEGCDSCACCGTHVAKTGEIRLIKILSAQKYKGGVRVTMLSGEKAYADYCLKHINTLGIARLLSVKPEEAGDAVVRLKQKNIEMKKEIKQLKKRTVCTAGSTGEKIMAKEKEIKTNAMRILDRQKIKYEVLQYECDEFIDGLHTAEKTGARRAVV